jgi:hypothetical protein
MPLLTARWIPRAGKKMFRMKTHDDKSLKTNGKQCGLCKFMKIKGLPNLDWGILGQSRGNSDYPQCWRGIELGISHEMRQSEFSARHHRDLRRAVIYENEP